MSEDRKGLKFTIVAPNKGVPVTPLLNTVDILLRLLEGDVHVPVYGLQLAFLVV